MSMPKVPPEHSADRSANDALRRIIPERWMFKNPRDMDSGREYGEDIVVEIVNEKTGEITGLEFGIQNKQGVKYRKAHISVPGIKLSTLEYLSKLPRPVMLHAYDSDKDKSYWCWIHDWYIKKYNDQLAGQVTTTIKIPKENILNEGSIDQIASGASRK